MDNIIIQAINKGNLDEVREKILSNSSWNKYEFQYLQKSLEDNKPEIARFLLSIGCRVETEKEKKALYSNYQSLLHLAVLGGYEDIVETLVNRGGSLIRNKYKATTLHYAVRKRNYKIIEFLLERFGNVDDMTKSGQSALHIAIEDSVFYYVPEFLQNSEELQDNIKRNEENLTIIKLLLRKGANIHLKNKFGESPLHRAIKKQNFDLINLLLEHDSCLSNNNCTLPLKVFKDNCVKRISHLLLKNVAKDMNLLEDFLKIQPDIRSLCDALKRKVVVATNYFDELVVEDINNKKLKIVEILLKYGASVNSIDKEGYTPLYIACKEENKNFVQLLLNYGSNPNLGDFKPINIAIQNNNIEIFEMLLANKVNINLADKTNKTALNYAVENSNVVIIEKLIKFGLDTKNTSNKIAFHSSLCSWETNCDKIAQVLSEHGFKVDKKCEMLHTAIQKRSLKTIQNFLMHGVDVNFKNANDKTSLFLLIESITRDKCSDENVFKIFDLLLQYGANFNIACPSENYFRIFCHHTPLQLACQKNEEKIVRRLLEHGADPNKFKKGGYSPLHIAVFSIDEQIVELLLQYGANVNAETEDGKTVLYIATENNLFDIVKIILKYNPDLHNKSNKNSIYLTLKSRDMTENADVLFEALLAYGYTLNMKKVNADIALYQAIMARFVNIAHYLLDNGVDLNCNSGNKLLIATEIAIEKYCHCDKKCKKILELLLKYKADTNVVYKKTYFWSNKRSFFDSWSDEDEDSFEKRFCTVLQLACERNNEEIVRCLLEYGADPNVFEETDFSPLQLAVLHKNYKIFELLLQRGADINVVSPLKRQAGYTLLHIGSIYFQHDIFELLLNAKLDVNACAKNDYTPLHIAVKHKNISAVELLLINGANVNAETKDGKTVLRLATENCLSNIVKIILKYNPDLHNESNKSCIYLAIKSKKENNDILFEALLAYGYTLNVKELDIKETLFTAISRGFVNIAKYLLDNGVDINVKYKSNKSILHVAAEYNIEKIILLLLNYASTKSEEILNCLINSKDDRGRTPIYYAKNEKIIKIFIKFRAKINVEDFYGNTLLHEAVYYDNIEVAKALLKFDPSIINSKNKLGMTPLCMYSTYFMTIKNLKFIKIFLLNGYNVNYITNQGRTLLDNACSYELKYICEDVEKHIIKMYAANFDLCKRNLRYIEEEISDDVENMDFLEECKLEVENLKIENADQSVSFYDILKADMNQLVIYARNMNIIVELNTPDFNERFPKYGELISCKFKRALNRRNLLDECCKQICSICEIFLTLPYECIEIIMNYLDNDDLRIMLPDSVITLIYDI